MLNINLKTSVKTTSMNLVLNKKVFQQHATARMLNSITSFCKMVFLKKEKKCQYVQVLERFFKFVLCEEINSGKELLN